MASCISFFSLFYLFSVVLSVAQCAPVDAAVQQEAVQFMKRFGYIDNGGGEHEPLITSLESAIKEVQKFGGIPETGVLDSETIKLMSSQRCGVPDKVKDSQEYLEEEKPNPFHHYHHHHHHHHGNHSHEHHLNETHRRKKRYILATRGWDKRHLTYYLENRTARLRREEILATFEEALGAWGKYGFLKFSRVDDPQIADISFSFRRREHGDPFPFDGKGYVLAHAFFPGSNRDYEGDIHFDDDEDWRINMAPREEGVDLYTVALHELGHSLGLSHSPSSGSVMNPYYQGSTRDLGYDDILAMHNLYAARRLKDDGIMDSRPRYPERPPTTRRTTTTPASWTTRGMETSTRRGIQGQGSWDGPRPEDGCFGSFDTVALIRNELFILKGKLMWRLYEPRRIQPNYPVDFHRFFSDLPPTVKRIDAIYQRAHDSYIVLFSGRHYWVYDGSKFLDTRPRSISDFGLPSYIEKVDAAASTNNTAILFTKDVYWRYNDYDKELDLASPRPITDWGLRYPIDAALNYKDGKTYLFQGDHFWIWDDRTKSIKAPRNRERASEYWLGC